MTSMTSFSCVITEAHSSAVEGNGASRKASFWESIAQGAVMSVRACPSGLHCTTSWFSLQHGLWNQTSLDSPLLLKALISFCKSMNQGQGHQPLRVAGKRNAGKASPGLGYRRLSCTVQNLGVLISQPSQGRSLLIRDQLSFFLECQLLS